MTFLNKLNAARNSAISAFHVFLLKYTESDNDIHAFFEGFEDSSFYVNVIKRFAAADRKIHVYQCGSKANVFDAFHKVSDRVGDAGTVLFFVDKDLSDILGEVYVEAPNIYTTEYYSIENYLVSEEMLETIWQDILRPKEEIVDFRVVLEKYREEYIRFCGFMVSVMAWVICMRKLNQKLNLNNVSLSKIYIINDEMTLELSAEAKSSGETVLFESMCNTKTHADCTKYYNDVILMLQNTSPKSYIRGKFELWFFVNFTSKLLRILHDMGVKSRVQLMEASAVEFLGPRMNPPQSLLQFLALNISEAE